jgi:protoheme IX farnesyltransferase
MVLVTVAVGFAAADRLRGDTPFRLLELTTAVLGTGLVAGAAGAWNMLLERDRDARMRRTAQRPLPIGALSPFEAGLFGTLLLVVGCSILGLFNNVLAAAMALLTFLLYVGVYTPLKARTTLNTAMGAIPGALPPAIGWAAATGQLGLEPLCLFLIVFLWQFPHFLAIAWLHRHDYAQAGYRMLTHPDLDPKGRITGRQALFHALALVPVGLLPSVVGLTGSWYFIGALALGTHYLAASAHFHHQPGDATARRLLKASFLYLPLLLSLLIYDRLPI